MKHPPSLLARHALVAYFALSFAIAWTLIAVAVKGAIPGTSDTIPSRVPFVFLAMLAGPSISAVALGWALDGRAGLKSLLDHELRRKVRMRWYAVALLLAPMLVFFVLLALSRISSSFVPEVIVSARRGTLVLLAVFVGLCAGFFEEIGWTGFATPRMLARFGTLRTGLLLGVIWAIWHGLADYWGGRGVYGSLWGLHALEWIVALAAFRVLMTWVYEHTESLFIAQLMHAGFTGSQALFGPSEATVGQSMLWYGLFAIALWMVVAAVRISSGKTSPFSRGAVPLSQAS